MTCLRRRNARLPGIICRRLQITADLGGNLDRQSARRYRARTAVRLAAGGKQALASLTSLCLAGRASIAAARRYAGIAPAGSFTINISHKPAKAALSS